MRDFVTLAGSSSLRRLVVALLFSLLMPTWALAGSSTTTTASADPATTRPGGTVKVEVKVTGPANTTPTGKVEIKDGTATLADGTLSDGKVMITLPTLALGVHELKANYAGTSSFDPSSATLRVNISLVSGKEFPVSMPATTAQADPVITRLRDGRFLAAWTTAGQDGSGLAVFGRLLSPAMKPIGKEFVINTTKTGDQVLPSVAALANGNAVVVWRDQNKGLRGRILLPTGHFRATELDIDATEKTGAPVAAAVGNGFVVAWPTQRIKGVRSAILMRFFTVDGVAKGKLIRVDTSKTDFSFDPAVMETSDGSVAVVWIQAEFGKTDPGKLRLRGFNKIGKALSTPRLASPDIKLPKATPALARLSDGSLVVVWAAFNLSKTGWDVLARPFATATGPARSAAFAVPGATDDDQMKPAVSAFSDGGYLVVWQSPDSVGNGIFARSFSNNSAPALTGIRINQTISGDQFRPVVAAVENGKALAAWITWRTGMIGQVLALE